MKQIIFYTVGFLLLVSAPVTGNDEVSSLVKLSISDCPVSFEETSRILNVELQSIIAGQRDDLVARPLIVTVTCGQTNIELSARNFADRPLSNRVISIQSHHPVGMERVIAIAATELALSTWEHLSVENSDETPIKEPEDPSSDINETMDDSAGPISNEAAGDKNAGKKELFRKIPSTDTEKKAPKPKKNGIKSGPTEAGAPKPPQTAGRASPFGFAVHLGAAWRMFLNDAIHVFGGELGADLRFPRLFRLQLCIAPEGGKTERPLGKISIFSVDAALTAGIIGRLFSLPLLGGADIGFRGGFGRLTGKPQADSSGDTLIGGIGGPLLRLSLASATRPAAELSIEAGYAFFGLTGLVDIGSPIEMKGFWMSVRLDGVFYVK